MKTTLSKEEKKDLNVKLVNDAVYVKKVGFYTEKEIYSINLSPEQRERALEKLQSPVDLDELIS